MIIEEDSLLPRFDPWIGDRYQNGISGGTKLLVLGEAHYSKDTNAGSQFTKGLVGDYVAGKWTHRFLTVTARIIGGSLSLPECRNLWRSVAFYNYVQDFPGPSARIRPSEQMWKNGRRPFIYVLGKLRPDAVLVLGKELWGHLSAPECSHARKKFDTSDGSKVISTYVNHPSSFGFSRGEAHESLSAFFSEVIRRPLQDGL